MQTSALMSSGLSKSLPLSTLHMNQMIFRRLCFPEPARLGDVAWAARSHDLATPGCFLEMLGSQIVEKPLTLRERDVVLNKHIRVDIRAINKGTVNSWL